MPTGSHFEFAFLHKPIVYGVARLLYGVATSDSVIHMPRVKHEFLSYFYSFFISVDLTLNLSFVNQ